ncbi:hypothetical protein [Bacillus sp. REN16]|uniref:hypothetical protein n=1 Tax=Bacillus sp. REN16 TaxID=2887296 RepID=UPI001E553CB1|nr:hypothetical protein [Bacillus sp. REN16]MCC3359107.1 hypothetical protein [Bacillus sp. REN16]
MRWVPIKNVVIYGQMCQDINEKLEEMKKFVNQQKWNLIEGIVDFEGSSEGLFSLLEKKKGIDIILIYNMNNISDDFNLEFLFKTSAAEKFEIKEYRKFKTFKND